jgi:hypothetical protein
MCPKHGYTHLPAFSPLLNDLKKYQNTHFIVTKARHSIGLHWPGMIFQWLDEKFLMIIGSFFGWFWWENYWGAYWGDDWIDIMTGFLLGWWSKWLWNDDHCWVGLLRWLFWWWFPNDHKTNMGLLGWLDWDKWNHETMIIDSLPGWFAEGLSDDQRMIKCLGWFLK